MSKTKRISLAIMLIVFIAALVLSAVNPEISSLEGLMTGIDIRLSANLLNQGHVITDEKEKIYVQPIGISMEVIYESDIVIVMMNAQQFERFQIWAVNNTPEVEILPLEALAESAKNDFEEGNYSYPENRYIISKIIKSGFVSIIDKRAGKEIDFIYLWKCTYTCGGLCGSGDWYFLFPNGSIFLTVNYLKF
jgi:hypothetical protein